MSGRVGFTWKVFQKWADEYKNLDSNVRDVVSAVLGTALGQTPTGWRNSYTNGHLCVALGRLPDALTFTYLGHKFPDAYDISSFRRFIMALIELYPDVAERLLPDLPALNWGKLGNDAKSQKTREAVHAYVARLQPTQSSELPAEPEPEPEADCPGEPAVSVEAVEIARLRQELASLRGSIDTEVKALRGSVTTALAWALAVGRALVIEAGITTPELDALTRTYQSGSGVYQRMQELTQG